MTTDERQLFWKALCKADGVNVLEDIENINRTIQYPRFLYRYRPVTVSSIDALQTNSLFFSHANYYDDPFDTLINIDYDSLHKNVIQILTSEDLHVQLDELCRTLGIPEEGKQWAENTISSRTTEEWSNYVDAFFRDKIQSLLKEMMWSVCFSESGTNETMWLKYADQYKGFCLVYDMNDDTKLLCGKQDKCGDCIMTSVGTSLFPVYYSDEGYDATEYARFLSIVNLIHDNVPFPIANSILSNIPNKLWEQERITLIKSKCHEHDEEWRMLFRSTAKGSVKQERIPYGIILGLKTSPQDRNTLIRSGKCAGIDHYFESYINKHYKLDVRELTV